MDARSILSPAETEATLAGSGFRNSQSHLVGAFTTADFRSAVQFVDAVADVAEELNHHPDVRLAWGHVEFALTSHDVGGVTRRDVALALRIRAIADELGATPA
ncbi:4a-hydroxytetrahydrobiopterin dehydratase [Agromyces mariniharenae]|uniref:Putative pterin-4-alpha-carbinolamine dehydratase n=1 Tax=Agromyces mariniharenae TaxID=2604423 RepID=A0A5S4V348_9MICO|nr:4a-hydroxytetrahydrobiopterin dehydratase [Agromyces mariniharenae]TYL52283.1 4a-hydroxytetrahydrobiopterin dehydratase [Agromyces mariniharenae]